MIIIAIRASRQKKMVKRYEDRKRRRLHAAEHHKAAEFFRGQAAAMENALQTVDLSYEQRLDAEQQIVDMKAQALAQDNCTCTEV